MKDVPNDDGLFVVDMGDDHAPLRWYAEYDTPYGLVNAARACPLDAVACVLESAARAWKQQEKAA